jgi:hypothetical protein
MGDWNQRLEQDPARLHAIVRSVWHGGRIDGGAASRGLNPHITRTRVVNDNRADNHDVIYLTITP